MPAFLLAAAILLAAAHSAVADLVATWNFGTTLGNSTPTIMSPIAGFFIDDMGKSNSLSGTSPFANSSPSTGYAGASGDFNFGNRHRNGALDIGDIGNNGSGYYWFVVTNNSGSAISLVDYDFGVMSESTGAQAYVLRTSVDSFAADIFSGTIVNDGTWSYKDHAFSPLSIANAASVEIRLYGYDGVGDPPSGNNTRLDDVTVRFAVAAVPEPGAVLFGGLVCGLAGLAAAVRRLLGRRVALVAPTTAKQEAYE